MTHLTKKQAVTLLVILLFTLLLAYRNYSMGEETKRCQQFSPKEETGVQYTRQDCYNAGCKPNMLGEWSCIPDRLF